MSSLEHLTVVVTRPTDQAQNFSRKLITAGARVVQFPTIEIAFRKNPLTDTENRQLQSSSLWIFTSANAVAGAAQLGIFDTAMKAETAVIGKATAGTLQLHGITADYVPDENTDSEGLLKLLENSKQRTASIIQGGTGREVLRRELENRGNSINTLDVYARQLPRQHDETVLNVTDALPCTICLTSNQGLDNLITLIPEKDQATLLQCDLVVNSRRCEALARSYGFNAGITVASPPGDNGQLKALFELTS